MRLTFALLSAYLVLFAGSFPRVYIDEPWESIPAYQLSSAGVLNDPVLEGRDFNGEHLLAPRLLQAVVLAPFYRLLGTHLLVGRAVSLLFAFGTLAILCHLLTQAGIAKPLVIGGAALLCTDNFFYIFARLVRPEILMTCLGLAAYTLLCTGLAERRRILLAAAGVVAGLGAWTHPNFLLLVAALFGVLGYELRWRGLCNPSPRIFIAGLAIGFLPYLAYLLYQDGGNHFVHLWAQVRDRAPQGESGFWARTLIEELERYRQYAFYPYRTPVVAGQLLFLGLSLRLKDRLSRHCLIVLLTHMMLLPVLIVSRNPRYFLPVVPFLVILVICNLQALHLTSPSRWLEALRGRAGWLAGGATAAAMVLVTYQAIGNPVMIAAKRVAGYEEVLADLRRVIPPRSRVWGSMMFWFGFTDCSYRTQYTFARDLETFRPHYIITGDDVVWIRERYFALEHGRRWDEVTRRVDEYTRRHGRLVAELADRGYGPLHVWQIDRGYPVAGGEHLLECEHPGSEQRGG